MGVRRAHNNISLNSRVGELNPNPYNYAQRSCAANLGDDVLVGEANDKPVFWGVVLVLILDREALSRVVVGLSLASSLELHLEALEVGTVLHHLDERHS